MNKRHTGFGLTALAAVLMLFEAAPRALAQDQGYDQDPPGRAGRVGYVQGSVSFQPGGEGDWLDAVPNRPLTTGDNLWADRDARAEVQIGSTSIRLAPETSLTFLDLEDNVTQLRVSVGSVYFRVRNLDRDDSFEVDTPNLAFNVTQPGQYRVDVNENGDQTTARVFRGDAEITGGGSSYRLGEGQEGRFSGTDQLTYDVGEVGRTDDFDQWALDRDRRQDSFRSSRYVSTEMTGYEDLDEYGDWHNVEGYGDVWTPRGVAGDWAPYRNGHWAYVSPWGWTWVEDEPWGFAPFHYGRWAYAGNGWCWVPGPVAVRPVYSPALVAFVGGGGFSVSVGVGAGVGWFPLGPGEVYVPWYRTSPRYVQSVNVTNTRVTNVQVTNVYNNVTVNHVNNVTYVNQRGGRGITVVNHDTFVNARPVNRNIERVDTRRFASAPVTHEVVRNIQPSRVSVIGAAHPVRQAPPAQVMSRQVVATRQPRVMNRPATPGMTRTAAPPSVRTVRAAPAGQAETLTRGARGQTRGGNAGGPAGGAGAPNRPGEPNNNRPGADNRPGAPENNRPANNAERPGAGVPRPGNPNQPGGPDRGAGAPRPNAPNNPEPRRNAPENNNQPRTSGPDNNRPGRNVPRPGSSGAGQPDRGPGSPNSNARPDNGRPDNGRPDNARPENARPDNGRPNNGRPDNARPNNARPDNAPAPEPRAPRPDNRSAAPENRPAPEPNNRPSPPADNRPSAPPENRRQAAPPDTRETPHAPENRHQAAPPEAREAPAPRPESRPAPPPQNQSRPEARPSNDRQQERPAKSEQPRGGKNDNGNRDNKDNKDKKQFR